MKAFFRKHRAALPALISFLIPVLISSIGFMIRGIAPFGINTLAAIDGFGQYFPMLREAERQFFHPHAFSFSGALGFSFFAESAYYTNSPLNILLFLFPGPVQVWQMDLLILLRFGLTSLSMYRLLSCRYADRSPVFSVLSSSYALSSYTLAFINQIMWMDALILLPLLVLQLERMLNALKADNRKRLLQSLARYVVLLALLILSCFYTAWIVCLFLCLYVLFLLVREKTPRKKDLFRFLLCFSGASLLSGLLSLPVLVPLLRAIRETLSVSSPSALGFSLLHGYGEYFLNLLPFREPSREYGAPNLYFGLFAAVPLLFALTSQKKPRRVKVSAAVFLVLLLLSMNVEAADYVFHGFHKPSQLPGRESFLFIFLTLFFSGSGVILLKSKKKECLLALLLLAEITANTLLSYSHVPCVSEKRVSYLDETVETVRDIITPELSRGEFYRTELLSYRDNGGQLYGFYGISFYSSLMSGDAYQFFTRLGVGIYARNVSTRYEDPQSMPLLNDLFAVRYLLSDDGTLIENEDALPLLFACSASVLPKGESAFPDETGYALQNSLFQAISDSEEQIVTKDGEVLEKGLQSALKGIRSYGTVQIREIREGTFQTTLTADCEILKDGMILMSLPAASVREVLLDGKPVPVRPVLGFLAAVPVTKGHHSLTVRLGG